MALQASKFYSTPARRIAAWLGLPTKPSVSVHKQAVLAAKAPEFTQTPFSAAANAVQRLASPLGDANGDCESSRRARATWGGAAMLAASLLFGIYIGVSGEVVRLLNF